MAGSVIGMIERITTQQGRPNLTEFTLICTADAIDHTYPITIINQLPAMTPYDLRGINLNAVFAIPGNPPPTLASELTILDKNGLDLLGGKGLDFISDTEKSWTCFGPYDWFIPVPISGNISVCITGNQVNGAVLTLIIQCLGM